MFSSSFMPKWEMGGPRNFGGNLEFQNHRERYQVFINNYFGRTLCYCQPDKVAVKTVISPVAGKAYLVM